MTSMTSLISSRAGAQRTTDAHAHTCHEISVKVWGNHTLPADVQAGATALLAGYIAEHLATVGVEADAHYVGALPC